MWQLTSSSNFCSSSSCFFFSSTFLVPKDGVGLGLKMRWRREEESEEEKEEGVKVRVDPCTITHCCETSHPFLSSPPLEKL